MARQIDMIINTVIKGQGGIRALQKEIKALNKARMNTVMIQKAVGVTTDLAIAKNKMQSATTLELIRANSMQRKSMLDSEIRANALNIVYEKQNEIIKKQRMELVLLEMTRKGEITATEAQMIQKKMMFELDSADMKMMQMRRREILATTMSIFGMTMSIWQVTNALQSMAGENEEARKEFQKLQAMLMGATGPILLVLGIMQLLNMTIKTQAQAIIRSAVPAMMALSFAVMAVTSQSKELKIIYSILTGVMVFLTVLSYKMAAAHLAAMSAKVGELGATIALKGATSGGATLFQDAIIVSGAIGIAAAAATAFASFAMGQTELGQYRRIEKSGFLIGHKGETIGRVTPPMEGDFGNERPIEIVLNIDGEEFNRVWARQAEREIFVG